MAKQISYSIMTLSSRPHYATATIYDNSTNVKIDEKEFHHPHDGPQYWNKAYGDAVAWAKQYME